MQHAATDEADMHRLVARSTPGDDCYLTWNEVATTDKLTVCAEYKELLMGAHEAFDAFGDHCVRCIHEFLHQTPPKAMII
jgi:hypothetical protein